MQKFILIFYLSVLTVSAADLYNFSLLPSNGTVQGAPGSTVGWGYSLENQSSTLWLVTTSVNAGSFQQGTPALLFDFPVLAPGTGVAAVFDPARSLGLYQLTWNASAPLGFSNTGTFVLSAQWWNGDPLGGGQFVTQAPGASAFYTATVVPEPGTLGLTTLVLCSLLLAAAVIRRAAHR